MNFIVILSSEFIPKIVAKRKQFGHWEGDSIVGLHHTSGLHTEYERIASMTRVEKMTRITAEQATQAARKIFGVLPAHARRSTTLDNGSEHVRHTSLVCRHILQIHTPPGKEEGMKMQTEW